MKVQKSHKVNNYLWKGKMKSWFIYLFVRLAPDLVLPYKEEFRLRLRKVQINLAFRSACTNFSPCFASAEIRRRLRKIKFYLLFRSACTNFVAESPNKRVARRVVWGDPNVRGACPRAGWDYTLWTCWRNCREENGTWCVGTSDADSIREDRIPSWE